MLSDIESFFVRLLRGTVVATALVAFLVTVGALLYAAYAQYSPEPKAALANRIDKLRKEIDPAGLIREIFPADSSVHKDASLPDTISYQRIAPTDEVLFSGLNKFLDSALDANFERREQFSEWLYGLRKIPLSWDSSIDNKEEKTEDNVNVLWRSLLNDYAKRLAYRSQSLAAARRQRLYAPSFEKLTLPTGQAQAPYFLVWFFEKLQAELRVVSEELRGQRVERELLRSTVPWALTVASAAFGYFIFIMFLFLIVSIEASVRHLAALRTSTPPPIPASQAEPGVETGLSR